LSGALGREGLIVVDVRTHREWAMGHIPGAIHIPLSELPRRLEELPADGSLITQCASGARSAIAASLLLMAGASSVENLAGGIQAWTNAGLTLTTEESPLPVVSAQPVPTVDAGAELADTGPEIPRFLERRKRKR
jgi:rhodanese-related sulfurtransferase